MRISFNALDFRFAQLFVFNQIAGKKKTFVLGVTRGIPFFFQNDSTFLFFQTLNAFIVYWVRGEKNDEAFLYGR